MLNNEVSERYLKRYEERFNDLETLYDEIEMSDELVDFFEKHKAQKDSMLDWVQDSKWWAEKCEAYAEMEEDYDPRER